MITIYHNPRCSKSRECLLLMEDNIIELLKNVKATKEEIEIVKYIDHPLEFDILYSIIQKLGITPLQLIRKNEAIWKTQFKGTDLSDKETIQAMIDFPKLMERPIVVKGNKAVIGRPPSRVLEIL